MNEYIKLDHVISRIETRASIAYREGDLASCFEVEKLIPTMSRLPKFSIPIIVKCKDCIHLENSGGYGICSKGYFGFVAPNDYCSRGESRQIIHREEE